MELVSCPDCGSGISLHKGDRCLFGHWDGEDIEWRVLAVSEDRALLITEMAIDSAKYHDGDVEQAITWEECSLRCWLNSSFYKEAFSEQERQSITLSHLENMDNPVYRTKGGNATDDYLFCLSMTEANSLFADDGDRLTRPTATAKAKGIYVLRDSDCCGWWLRTPGGRQCMAAYVRTIGYVVDSGDYTVKDTIGVRPAMWLDLGKPTSEQVADDSDAADSQTQSEEGCAKLVSIPYTVEPGFRACNAFLPRKNVGGIGALNMSYELHDYENDDDYPGLSNFLDTLSFVDGNYPSYYTTSPREIDVYFRGYIGRFFPRKDSTAFEYRMAEILEQYLRDYGSYRDGPNIVMGRDFYNSIFYHLSFMMALELIPHELILECMADLGPSSLPKEKRFVNEFDHFEKCTFIFDYPDGCFHAEDCYANAIDERLYGPIYHCSKRDYENYWKPYVLFLSNFSLILGVKMATDLFGECAFTIGWESDFHMDLPRERWPHPRAKLRL